MRFLSQLNIVCPLCLLLVISIATCAAPKKPKRLIKLPISLEEASGLSIQNDTSFYLHNDSGDGPFLYAFNPANNDIKPLRIPAQAKDWEDLTCDEVGHFYIADTGNNAGKRLRQVIYRYDATSAQSDSIVFTYPQQNGSGRLVRGNYDCEAIVFANNQLHLFTKALAGRRKSYWAYHFRLPAEPGKYEAELVDSLYLPRRVITAACLDSERQELVLTAYNYKRVFGFFPAVASSLISITDYPEGRFFEGKIERRNLSWAVPTQYEAVDFYDDRYLYIATERTKMKKQGLRRVRRKHSR